MERRKKEYSILSTVFEMALFFYTEKEEVYRESLTICEGLKNIPNKEVSDLVLIHPDHHTCYFYHGFHDHKKIKSFLELHEKAALRPFDHLSLDMHRFYDLPIVVLFTQSSEGDTMKLFEEIARDYHKHFFFTYVDERILQGEYPVFTLMGNEQKFKRQDKAFVDSLVAELGVQEKDFPKLFVF